MKYCAVKYIKGNLTTGIIAQGEDGEALIKQALKTEYEGRFLTEDDIVILTEKEYQQRLENEPKPPQEPTEIEMLKQENEILQNQLASINSDLQGFMDFYFTTL